MCKNLVYTVILLFIDFFLLKLSFKYTISVFTKQNVLLNIYIPNFRTFWHFIKKLCCFLFLLKSYCFLYTGLSYYSDDILICTWFYDLPCFLYIKENITFVSWKLTILWACGHLLPINNYCCIVLYTIKLISLSDTTSIEHKSQPVS